MRSLPIMLSHFLRKWWPWGRTPAETAARVADGTRWHVLPAAAPYFEVPALAEWVRTGRAAVVKENLQRTIYRVPLPGGTVYVKVCRANTPRAFAREILRPPKARLEFENALRLLALGIGCTTPLAWGEADSIWPGDSIILTREQADAEPLDGYLVEKLPAAPIAVRRQVATELGRFVAKLHDAGVRHPDPHPGNLLVEVPPSRVPHFFLLDVHAVRFGPPMGWDESRANLVLLNRWFQMRATRADRARFWRAYAAARATLVSHDQAGYAPDARQVEAATLASNLRFWAGRIGRYLGNNRQFRKVKRGSLRGHAVREFPAELLTELLADPDVVFARPGVVLLKDSTSATVGLIRAGSVSDGSSDRPSLTLPARTDNFIFKRFRLKKRFAALRNLLRRSPALRSWINGHALLDRDLPTARPLLLLHRYEHGLPREGYVLFEFVAGAFSLTDAVARFDRRPLAERLGRLLRTMHDRQVSHADLKAPNILVTPAGDPVLIDLVGVTTGRAVPEPQRVRELTRLAASFAGSAVVTRTDHLRLLRAYLGSWRAGGVSPLLGSRKQGANAPRSPNPAGWKSWWRRIADGVRAKIRRNANLGRPLG